MRDIDDEWLDTDIWHYAKENHLTIRANPVADWELRIQQYRVFYGEFQEFQGHHGIPGNSRDTIRNSSL